MQKLMILPGIIIGLSFHEFAHAFVAYKLGDPTPKVQGRVTLNPLAHVDPFGFICLLLVGFGWGKPVQINENNFRNLRRDDLLVSIAGVTMNLILAFILAGLLRLGVAVAPDFWTEKMGEIIWVMMLGAIQINLVLMIFNLIPVPPLDGFSVFTELFNVKRTRLFYQIYRYGPMILIVMILFNVTDLILTPLVTWSYNFVMGVFF